MSFAEFSCLICNKVLNLPITTPCAHNFCKTCLDGAFEGQKFVRERSTGGRQLRTRKNVMKCPSCPTDISEFLQTAQVCPWNASYMASNSTLHILLLRR